MMEKPMLIKGNEVQSLNERNLHLWLNDSSTLYNVNGSSENYVRKTNNIFESKGGSFILKLTQQRSDDLSIVFGLDTANVFLAADEEEIIQNDKSQRRTNKHYLKFCGTDMQYENNFLREITIPLNQSHIWPIFSNNTATDYCMNHVVKYNRNCIEEESTQKYNCDHHPNNFLNTLNYVIHNIFISEPTKFVQISSSLDNITYNQTEKVYLFNNKIDAIMSYLEADCKISWKSWLSESLKLNPIELVYTICADYKSAVIPNNKISSINITKENYSLNISVNDRNVIFNSKKVIPKMTYLKTIKYNPFIDINKSYTFFNGCSVKLNSAVHSINSKDNFHNSVMSYLNLQANKRILQCNYKQSCIKIGKKVMSHYLLDFKNFLKYDPDVRKELINVASQNGVIYSGKMKNIRNIFKISTIELYDKLSDSIKCLHERLEGLSQFFASIRKEFDHKRFIRRRNESYASKSGFTRMNDVIQKCTKKSFAMNHVETNQNDRSVMSVSTQTDTSIFRAVSKKCKQTVGCQTKLMCNCSEIRSNLSSNTSYKRKLEALNLETFSSKKVFTYKYINFESIGNKSIISEETNTDQQGKKKGNDSCEPSNKEPKSDSLKAVAKKNVFSYSHTMESKSHLEPPAGNCCRRGIRLGLSKKLRPNRKLAL